MAKKILSIDGGGVRGIIPAYICMRLEEDLGQPIYELFDFISGTSTGAILGAALARGIPAKDAYGLYASKSDKVFKSRHAWYKPWAYITTPKYDRNVLLELTRELYGAETKLSDTKVPFMCTAYNTMEQNNTFFTSWEDEFKDEILVDVIGKSWAAPFYFGQWRETGDEPVIYCDGGVGIYNNLAFKSLLKDPDKSRWEGDEERLMINLGCGNYVETYSYKEVSSWMNIKEAWHNVFGSKAARDIQLETLQEEFFTSKMVPNLEFKSYEPQLERKIYTLDGVKYIPQYIELAEELYKSIDISSVFE
jgi:hypothetical protein